SSVAAIDTTPSAATMVWMGDGVAEDSVGGNRLGADQRLAAPSETELAVLLRPRVTAAVEARILPTQRLLLAKGAFIDCTLETAIDSTLPGMATCITATDTFGVDGKV